MELKLHSYAKINLFLRVFQKLKTGYHKIESVMQRIDLYDTMKFKISDNGIEITSNNPDLEDEGNLAYKAAKLLKDEYGIASGVKIYLEKNIPVSSGLGGGSSNAATTLIALNKLWRLRINDKKMIQLAAKLGSDVPFFLGENAAFVSGIGDKLRPIQKPYKMNIILINPGFHLSTKNAYSTLDKYKAGREKKPAASSMVRAMANNNISEIASNIYNDFEIPISKKFPILKEIKTNLRRNRALNSTLGGSGPTMFGMFSSIYTAREAYYELKDMYPFVILAKTI